MSLFKQMEDRLEALRLQGAAFEEKMRRDYPGLLVLWQELAEKVDYCKGPIRDAEAARDRFLSELDRLEKTERPARPREEPKSQGKVEGSKKPFHHPAFDQIPERLEFRFEDERGVYAKLNRVRGTIKVIPDRNSSWKPLKGETWRVEPKWLVSETAGFCIVSVNCLPEPADLSSLLTGVLPGQIDEALTAEVVATMTASEPSTLLPTEEPRVEEPVNFSTTTISKNVMTMAEARRDPTIAWPGQARATQKSGEEKKARKDRKKANRDKQKSRGQNNRDD